jgi:hypothetical protein
MPRGGHARPGRLADGVGEHVLRGRPDELLRTRERVGFVESVSHSRCVHLWIEQLGEGSHGTIVLLIRTCQIGKATYLSACLGLEQGIVLGTQQLQLLVCGDLWDREKASLPEEGDQAVHPSVQVSARVGVPPKPLCARRRLHHPTTSPAAGV